MGLFELLRRLAIAHGSFADYQEVEDVLNAVCTLIKYALSIFIHNNLYI